MCQTQAHQPSFTATTMPEIVALIKNNNAYRNINPWICVEAFGVWQGYVKRQKVYSWNPLCYRCVLYFKRTNAGVWQLRKMTVQVIYELLGWENLVRKQKQEYQVDPNLQKIKNILLNASDYWTMTSDSGWPAKSNCCRQCWTVTR